MFQKINKNTVAIIGAGPVGLYFASLCEEKKLDYVVFEANEYIGGQIVNLYPNKKILDIVNFENHCAIDLIEHLKKKIDLNKIHLNEKVNNIVNHKLITTKDEYQFKYIVIAVGLGAYSPRPLGIDGENDCDNILYSLKDFSFLKNKKVAIFGGGDSALDWAKEISSFSGDVYLVHRRLEFRGNANTIRDCKNLKMHLPYIPFALKIQDHKCKIITIKKVDDDKYIDIPVDYVLVNYGSVPINTPFNYPHEGSFLKVNAKYKLDEDIYAIGDCIFYQGKIRRIEPGKKEAHIVFDDIVSKM